MTQLHNYQDSRTGCYPNIRMDNGDPCLISVAQTGVLVRKSKIGFFGAKFYEQTLVYEAAMTAKALAYLLPANLAFGSAGGRASIGQIGLGVRRHRCPYKLVSRRSAMRLGIVVIVVVAAATAGVAMGSLGERMRSAAGCPMFARITSPPGYVRVNTISKARIREDVVVIDQVGLMPLASWLQLVEACGGRVNIFDVLRDDRGRQGPRSG